MKNRLAAAIIAGMTVMSVWACGAAQGAQAPSETESEAPSETESEAPSETESEAPSETESEAPAETEAETPADYIPTFTLEAYSKMESAESGETIATCSYETVKLTEETAMLYTTLNKTLEGANDEITARYQKYYDEIKEAAAAAYQDHDDGEDQFPKGEISGSIQAVRADAKALSLLESCYTYYPGAAHGMTGYTGYNYDLSGAPIELTDVFKDPKALVPVVAENLTSMADGSAIEVEDGLLESAFGENYDDLTWVVERDGVSFIFAASDIAPYAAGPLEARISFDKYPELFTGKYGPAEGSYVKKLSEYTQTLIDLDGDGTSEKVLVTSVSEDEDAYRQSAIRIVIDGQSFDTEEEFYSQEPYFIHMADGRNYIYTVTGSDNDYPTLIVFEIKDKTPAKVGEMGGTGFAAEYNAVLNEKGELDEDKTFSTIYPMIDPANFKLRTRMDLMSSYSGQRDYTMGSDGMPAALTEYYTIHVDFKLTTLQPLTAEKVDTETGEATGEQGEIPAGTQCTFWRTNGVDTVDLMLEDGSAYRFKVDPQSSPITVNGINYDEAFEGMQFAG